MTSRAQLSTQGTVTHGRVAPGPVDTCCTRQTRKVASQLILKRRFDRPSVWSVKPAGLLELTCAHYRIWVPEAAPSK